MITEILKNIDWPTACLVIDFETYFDSEYHMGKGKEALSTYEYVKDPRFDFLGCGFAVLNFRYEEIPFFIPTHDLSSYIRILQQIVGKNLEDCTVIIQNAKFDALILKEKFGIIPPYIIDILDLSRHYDSRMSHKLKDLAKMFKLSPKLDTAQFKGLHYKDLSSEQCQALETYCCRDIEIETELFKILLPLLSNPEVELPLARHTLELFFRNGIKFDFNKAEELKGKMSEELENAITRTGFTRKEISGNISFAKILQKALPEGENVPLKKGKNGPIPAIAKNDEGCKELLIHKNEQVRDLMIARLGLRSWALHIKRINNMIAQSKVNDGYLPIALKYFGAHTGRWGGTEKTNVQNLGGRGRAGKGTHPLITAMRAMLCTLDGYTMAITDSAQIEARILAWLADQMDLLEGFAKGEDIYAVFATNLFQYPIRKEEDDDPDPVKQFLKIRRGFGKDAILGAGYGMGKDKFYNNCYENDDLRPYFDEGIYNRKFIEKLIKTYRTTYSQIPKFWSQVEKAFRWVIKYPHETCELDYGLKFWKEGSTVFIQLPSTRVLRYRHCSVTWDGNITWQWGALWGGSITENIVQSVARDLLGYWILECEEAKLDINLHVHDELVSVVRDTEDAELSLQKMINIVSTGPAWAEGLPLSAKGELSSVYKK